MPKVIDYEDAPNNITGSDYTKMCLLFSAIEGLASTGGKQIGDAYTEDDRPQRTDIRKRVNSTIFALKYLTESLSDLFYDYGPESYKSN